MKQERTMKKIISISIFILLGTTITNAATFTPWWMQPTVCRYIQTSCYDKMGVGYDSEVWDAGSNCRGMKLICPDALTETASEPQPIGKKALNDKNFVKSDYDTNLLNTADACYGRRKTSNSGSMAVVNGKDVKIWCPGILNYVNIDILEELDNGEIAKDNKEPTCKELAKYGYVATENNGCYGTEYDISEYYIECEGNDKLPARIVKLNGADTGSASDNTPQTLSDANKLMDKMYSISKQQKAQYFNK